MNSSYKTAVLVNFSANQNSGEKHWKSIEGEVLRLLPPDACVITYRIPFDIKQCIHDLITNQKILCFISAGGDGSVNCVLNAIIASQGESLENFYLGGIGLGSSNDFLKPNPKTVMGIPCKINVCNARLSDIGKTIYLNENLEEETRYFIINTSLGFTALGNHLFNEGDFIINKLKSRKTVDLAIYFTVLKTLWKYKNQPVIIHFDSHTEKIRITNISIVKNPNISGNFKYDQDIEPDDGMLGVNYCFDMGKLEILKILNDLMKGRFSGKPKRMSFLTKAIKIDTENFLPFETDGEVQHAKDIKFSVLPKAIKILGN